LASKVLYCISINKEVSRLFGERWPRNKSTSGKKGAGNGTKEKVQNRTFGTGQGKKGTPGLREPRKISRPNWLRFLSPKPPGGAEARGTAWQGNAKIKEADGRSGDILARGYAATPRSKWGSEKRASPAIEKSLRHALCEGLWAAGEKRKKNRKTRSPGRRQKGEI